MVTWSDLLSLFSVVIAAILLGLELSKHDKE